MPPGGSVGTLAACMLVSCAFLPVYLLELVFITMTGACIVQYLILISNFKFF